MSSPTFDLSKVQSTSLANSFKNDGNVYVGTLNFPTSIAAHSFVQVTATATVVSNPQFTILYGNYQEYFDTVQQLTVGSGYNTAKWYQTSINNKVGLVIPSGIHAGALDGLIFPVINGTTVTITGLVNNPYADPITITPLAVPFALIEYTLTN